MNIAKIQLKLNVTIKHAKPQRVVPTTLGVADHILIAIIVNVHHAKTILVKQFAQVLHLFVIHLVEHVKNVLIILNAKMQLNHSVKVMVSVAFVLMLQLNVLITHLFVTL